jgi:hypothetical protein
MGDLTHQLQDRFSPLVFQRCRRRSPGGLRGDGIVEFIQSRAKSRQIRGRFRERRVVGHSRQDRIRHRNDLSVGRVPETQSYPGFSHGIDLLLMSRTETFLNANDNSIRDGKDFLVHGDTYFPREDNRFRDKLNVRRHDDNCFHDEDDRFPGGINRLPSKEDSIFHG